MGGVPALERRPGPQKWGQRHGEAFKLKGSIPPTYGYGMPFPKMFSKARSSSASSTQSSGAPWPPTAMRLSPYNFFLSLNVSCQASDHLSRLIPEMREPWHPYVEGWVGFLPLHNSEPLDRRAHLGPACPSCTKDGRPPGIHNHRTHAKMLDSDTNGTPEALGDRNP